ncbi:DinB family protein [Paenibacillus wynnii]|uniref:DinB family protein n=1 Tax=Paenibacillus wynnii TaxID=268407 RepID=UPI00278CECD0|nr:DinB family protein [Paenibacillus wynnii]MDQ0194441.1 hypothetical protein [Paenibacillus wynnii]
MEQRPNRNEYGDFYADYISLVPENGELVTIFREQSQAIFAFLGELSEVQGEYRYASEKWNIKQIIGHLIDNDRIISYRLLRIARGDKTPLAGYEENDYVDSGCFDRFTLKQMVDHYKLVRESTLVLLESLPQEAGIRTGTANDSLISVRALICVLIGHVIHHLNVIHERYLNREV